MNSKKFNLIILLLAVVILFSPAIAKKKKKTAYIFKDIIRLPATTMKSQGSTGTCWIFSSISFIESEILRKGGKELDLSEMFIARNSYPHKASQYVYMHGMANFGPGGQFHDVLDQIRDHGLVPDSIYPGKLKNQFRHNHGELGSVLDGFLKGVIKRRGRKLTPYWMKAMNSILDVYLGKIPESFSFGGKSYTPQKFRDELGINPDNYIEITSYTHHPFYKKFRLEVPDNWSFDRNYYNVPIDELVEIVKESLKKGYTFVWDADVSEKFFSKDRTDVAVVPEKEWERKTRKEREAKIKKPVKEKTITQEMRQESFENWTTTDDHLMHITGLTKDQRGKEFFIMKNSWGTDHKYKGYYYVSIPYFRLKTICIGIHKATLTDEMKKKLGI